MNILHTTNKTFEKAITIANGYKALVNGCRRQDEIYNKKLIEILKQQNKRVDKLPKSYTIVYHHNDNLGTKRYNDYIAKVYTKTIDRRASARETEKSLIVEYPISKYKVIIPEDKIVSFVW